MKRILSLILAIVPLINMAQSTTRFVEQGKCWHMHYSDPEMYPEVEYDFTYYLDGDTIIGGQTCTKFYVENQHGDGTVEYLAGFFEKEKDKEVYFIPKGSEKAFLLYDFSAEEGSSVVIDDFIHPGEFTQQMNVQISENKTFLGVNRNFQRVYREKNEKRFPSGWWIEGIGSELGPINTWGFEAVGFPSILVSCNVGDKILFNISAFREAMRQEYMDPQTKVIYTYELGSGKAMVKEGYWYARGGVDEELEIIDVPGCPDVTGDITILGSFTVDGQEYTVTHIGDHAFYGCSEITSVTLPESLLSIGGFSFFACYNLINIEFPKSVRSIGERAFVLCSKLVSFVSHIEEPFITYGFGESKSKATLYVPKGCEAKYSATKGWNIFAKIVEMDTTGILLPGSNGQEKTKEPVYDLQGRRIQPEVIHKGIYIQNGKKFVVE